MGIEEIMSSFNGDIGYYVISMGKLAISKVCMGTLEIYPSFYMLKNRIFFLCTSHSQHSYLNKLIPSLSVNFPTCSIFFLIITQFG